MFSLCHPVILSFLRSDYQTILPEIHDTKYPFFVLQLDFSIGIPQAPPPPAPLRFSLNSSILTGTCLPNYKCIYVTKLKLQNQNPAVMRQFHPFRREPSLYPTASNIPPYLFPCSAIWVMRLMKHEWRTLLVDIKGLFEEIERKQTYKFVLQHKTQFKSE